MSSQQNDRTAQTLTLRDGRILGYAEWGDLSGKPVLFFGGSNSSRLSRHPDNSILLELGVHLYTFDRPGMGLSSRQKNRTLLDWADDIRDFAQQKQIEEFAILAASQGGPYGAACAYALPELLSSVALVSTVAGLDDSSVMATQNFAIKSQIFMSRYLPALLTLQFNMMRPFLRGSGAERIIKSILKNLPESDQAIVSSSNIVTMMADDIREGIRNGGAGATDDMRAVILGWDFSLEEIQTEVFIWQGEDDPNVTPAMAKYMAKRIPNNSIKFVPDAGHLLIFSHWRDTLAQIVENLGA